LALPWTTLVPASGSRMCEVTHISMLKDVIVVQSLGHDDFSVTEVCPADAVRRRWQALTTCRPGNNVWMSGRSVRLCWVSELGRGTRQDEPAARGRLGYEKLALSESKWLILATDRCDPSKQCHAWLTALENKKSGGHLPAVHQYV